MVLARKKKGKHFLQIFGGWKYFLDNLWKSDKCWSSLETNRGRILQNIGDAAPYFWKITKIRDEHLLNFLDRCSLPASSPVHCFSPGCRFGRAFFVLSRLDSEGPTECQSDRSRQELSNDRNLALTMLPEFGFVAEMWLCWFRNLLGVLFFFEKDGTHLLVCLFRYSRERVL